MWTEANDRSIEQLETYLAAKSRPYDRRAARRLFRQLLRRTMAGGVA